MNKLDEMLKRKRLLDKEIEEYIKENRTFVFATDAVGFRSGAVIMNTDGSLKIENGYQATWIPGEFFPAFKDWLNSL
jgi:hypothetical protein